MTLDVQVNPSVTTPPISVSVYEVVPDGWSATPDAAGWFVSAIGGSPCTDIQGREYLCDRVRWELSGSPMASVQLQYAAVPPTRTSGVREFAGGWARVALSGAGEIKVPIDGGNQVSCPTLTPTGSPTRTPTTGPSFTATASATATSTSTATTSPTRTGTATPTVTAASTATRSASPSASPTPSPSPTGLASCNGDCNGDQAVTVDDLLSMVNIALGQGSIATCPAADANDDGSITIDDITVAVGKALTGCP